MVTDYDPAAIEERWQRAWEQAKLFEPQREEGRKKFFIIFAYPGISGFLHVGHMRGYSYCDAIARHHRQLGENVLFPAGFHASGIPAVSFARKVERGDEGALASLRAEGTDEATISKLKDPAFVVSFFSKVYEERYWRKFGFAIDYRTLCSTIDPGYSRFIQWQFRKLDQRGLLVAKPHFAPFCPASGPVAVDASETDVSKGGDAEVLAFTALKFRTEEGVVFPCATLRPETVFGATNLWVNPAVTYVLADVAGERWVLSPEALRKADLLIEGGAKEVGAVSGRELVGKSAKAPLTGAAVRIFPASFVDPAVGTGVVMSVPGHAPWDFQALEELRHHPDGANAEQLQAVAPLVIIGAPGASAAGGSPAEAAVRARGAKSVADREALDAATDDVYSLEFHQGRMLPNTGAYAGLLCSDAREKIVRDLIDSAKGVPFPAFSKEVICRCGQQVLIKRIPKQWFIKYSDEGLTEAAAAHAASMHVTPTEYARDLPSTLRWFSDRACIRQGAWLGTRFPLDEEWIIEPISDSTLYPAYYTVSPRVASGELPVEWLTDAFFDHVFLGRGDAGAVGGATRDLVETCRRDFLYWYPLDVNLGGKEHKTVHFPAFIKNHVGILAPEHWPRGIFVNFWVTQTKGEKLSKSKGGAQPVAQLAAKFGVDALRLYYAHASAPWLDVEWDPDGVIDYRQRLARIHDTVKAIAADDFARLGARVELPQDPLLDRWLASAMTQRAAEARVGWQALDFRQVANPVFFGALADLRWYVRRGGRNPKAMRAFASGWAALMAPIAPHLAEELHHALRAPGFASDARTPRVDGVPRDRQAEAVEAYLAALLDDTQRIRQVAESFAQQNLAVPVAERAASRTVRAELLGADAPFVFPPMVDREVTLKGEKFALVFSGGGKKVPLMIQARRALSGDDVDKAARAADGGTSWVIALAGAPAEVRGRAKSLGVMVTGPAEFELLAEDLGKPLSRPQPKGVSLVTCEPWKVLLYARALEMATSGGRVDVGALLKAAAADIGLSSHMKRAPKVAQEAAREAGALKPAELKARREALESLDEYRALRGASAFLTAEFGCPVEVMSADNPESKAERLRGKAEAAMPLRPAIAIEY